MDSNHLVKMPIFSIHGNHDSPVGLDLLSSMDQLNENSYINYFGKVENIETVSVEPVILIKGTTKIALYGIGHISDTRFNLLKERDELSFCRPTNPDGTIDESFFSILVVH